MKFKSTNEIETIQLRDAQIKEMKLVGVGEVEEAASPKGLRARWMELYVEGAVVKDNNSQNEYYTDKYADQMEIRFKNPVIEAVLLEGHKYYDANDVLQSEVPDYELSVVETAEFPKSCEGAYLFEMKQDADGYVLGIEFVDPEDQTVGDSYQVYVTGTQVAMLWEQYMNRVQS